MMIPAKLATPRAAMMAVFAAFGVVVGVFSGSIPELIRQTGLSAYEFGIGLTVSTLSTALAMALVGPLARHVSNRAGLLVLLPLIGLSSIWVMASGSMASFFFAAFAFGAAMGGTDLFMNAEAGAIEHDLKRPVFTAFHGAVSIAIAASALLGSWVTIKAGTFPSALIGTAALAMAWLMVRAHVPSRITAQTMAEPRGPLPHRPTILLLGVISGLCVSCEIAAIQWSAKLLDDQAPTLAAIAGLGAAFYGLCNAAVRFRGDRLRARFGDIKALRASLVIAIAGFAGLGLSTTFGTGVAAFAVIGFGAALLTPCTFASIARLAPDAKARALSFSSLVASPPRIVSPFLFGWVAAAQGATWAFALCGVALVAALMLSFLMKTAVE